MIRNSIRRKRRWPFVLAVGVLACLVSVLLLPGAGGSAPFPKTRGGDRVFVAADLGGGDFTGTRTKQSAQPEQRAAAPTAALALDAATPARQGEYASDTIKADFPFNAIDLHWVAQTPAGAGIAAEVRFSGDGSTWGDWQPVPVDDEERPDRLPPGISPDETFGQLVFTDGSRYFQYRLRLTADPVGNSPEITRVTASYVDSKGYEESWQPLAFISRIPGRLLAFLEPSQGKAAGAYLSRADWGANESWMTWTPEYAPVKKQIIHHTVTSNSDPDPAATVRAIYYDHAVTRQWGDIGYNYLIDQQGRVYEGRRGGLGVIGGHAMGWNTGSVGISALGNFETAEVSAAMYSAFVELTAALSNYFHINPNGSDYFTYSGGSGYPANFLGHRDTYATACPGAKLYARLPQLRTDAGARYGPSYPINSPFLEAWQALGGAPGNATGNAYDIPGGRAQNFQNGRLIFVQATELVHWVYGGILAKYDSINNWYSALGLPSTGEYGVSSGRANDFSGGKIYWSEASGAHYVWGGVLDKYLSAGGPFVLGFPVTDEYDVPGVPGARESDFQAGRVYWDSARGAHTIYGGILADYLYWGGAASLGLPASDEKDVAGRAGARMNDLATGWKIYWHANTGAHLVAGDIQTKHEELGGAAGFCGLPASEATAVPTGWAQVFENAMLTKGAAGPAYLTYGGILAKYRELSGPLGPLGVAVTDEFSPPGHADTRESDFVGGRIFWSEATGTLFIYGGIAVRYGQLGGAGGALGVPVSNEHDVSGVAGARQSDFQGGSIYWSAATGAWEVLNGPMRDRWLEHGGPVTFGLPLGAVIDAGSYQEEDFQHGRIYQSGATGVHAVYGGILFKYLEAGGPGSGLGLPVSEEYASGQGRRSDFAGGYIYWDAATGASVHLS